MDIVVGNGFGDPSSNNLDKAVCNSQRANTFGKCMHPTILPTAMCEIEGQGMLFNFRMATGLGEGKLWIQTS